MYTAKLILHPKPNGMITKADSTVTSLTCLYKGESQSTWNGESSYECHAYVYNISTVGLLDLE